MLNILAKITKAAVAVAVTPATLVADLCTLPASAYNDRNPFARTERTLKRAGDCVTEATRPIPGGKS